MFGCTRGSGESGRGAGSRTHLGVQAPLVELRTRRSRRELRGRGERPAGSEIAIAAPNRVPRAGLRSNSKRANCRERQARTAEGLLYHSAFLYQSALLAPFLGHCEGELGECWGNCSLAWSSAHAHSNRGRGAVPKNKLRSPLKGSRRMVSMPAAERSPSAVLVCLSRQFSLLLFPRGVLRRAMEPERCPASPLPRAVLRVLSVPSAISASAGPKR